MGVSVSLTPYTLGGNSSAPSSGTTLSFTLTHAVAQGDALVVTAATDGGSETVTSLADSKGNTWTQIESDNTQYGHSVFVCLNAVAMTTSDTITATYSGAGGSHTIVGRGCPGVWTNAAVDVAISNSSAGSTSPSSGSSGTLRQSSEWAVASFVNANGGGTPSAFTGGFTAQLTEHATSNQYHTIADQTVSASTALTAGATITSAKWTVILVTLRAGPYVVASGSQASGSTTHTVTASANVAAGDASIVVVGCGSATVAPSSVTDSASQTYTLRASQTVNNMQSWIYVKIGSAALTSGTSTFTVTWNSTTGAKYLMALGCNGLASPTAFDQTAADGSSGLSPSSGPTPTLSQANEVAIGVIMGGSAASSVSFASSWQQLGSTLRNGSGVYFAVGFLTTSSTAGVTTTGSLGASAAWGALAATFIPASGGGAGGGGGGGGSSFAITTTSPLPDATVGTAYTDQLQTANGVAPVTFSVTAGSVPPGMSLSTGIASGGSSAIANWMAVGGPDGSAGMNFSDWQTANSTIGPITGAKIFYGGDLPASWTTKGSVSAAAPTGTSPADIAGAGGIPIICWNGPSGIQPSSAATINAFISKIPAGQVVVFCWQGEPENPTSGFSSGSSYVSGFSQIAKVIHAAGNPNLLTMHAGTWGQYGPTGRAYDGSFLPSGADTDIYGLDIYQHQAGGSLSGATSWSTNGLSNNAFWQRYVTLVKPLAAPLGRAMALSEYGIDNTTSNSLRNTRLQQDFAYIQGAFGPGGSVSTVPLFCWLYWWHNMAQSNNQYKFTDSATIATAKSIASYAGTGSGGGTAGPGGILSGTCNTAGTYTFTAQATDSASHTASQAFSITVDAAGSLSIVSTSPLAGGTINVAYSVPLVASGGVPSYTWSLLSGTLPSGLSLDPTGNITGTPLAAGTSTFTLQVTDSTAGTPLTASATFSLTISTTLAITTTSLPSGTVGTAYSQVLAEANGTAPFTWGLTGSSGALPDGLSIDPDGSITGTAGTVYGTPTTAGVFQFTVQVQDSGGATATQDLSITISPASGGLASPGRRVFGGAVGSQVITFSGANVERASTVTLTYWNTFANNTGTQYTDLTDMNGSPISSVVTDANGFPPQFKGPSGVLAMYEDANNGAGPRRLVICDDIGDLITAIVTAVQGQVGT